MAKASLTAMMMIGLAGGIATGCATEVDELDVETSTTRQQLPAQSCFTTFYSDASMTTEVGFCILACNGVRFCDGTQTSFHDRSCEPCL